MRRIAALLLIPTLLLPAACGGGGGDGDAKVAATTAPGVPGEPTLLSGTAFGEEPKVSTKGEPPKEIQLKVLKEGDGKVVKSGDILVANFKGQVWEPGGIELIPFENSFESKSPMVRPIGSGGIIAAWDKKVPGSKVGSRLLLTAPPSEALGNTGNQAAGILPNDTLVFVIDILDAFSPKEAATGVAKPAGPGLPTVKGTTSPTISIPKGGSPPKTLVDKVLIEGKGPAVKDAQFLAVHYTGVVWRSTAKTFDSSWERKGGSVPIGITIGEGIIEGWSKGLTGKKVGSRVLLVVPPADAYGKDGLKVAGITATDTLVFVVDILRAY